MPLQLHAESHLDHGLSPAHLEFLLKRFADRSGFFVETVTLPAELSALSCALYGPKMGDLPIPETEVSYERRGERTWASRVVYRPSRPSRLVTVIAGPYKGEPCVLYTAHGGPAAAKEPGSMPANAPPRELDAARDFWALHALAVSGK